MKKIISLFTLLAVTTISQAQNPYQLQNSDFEDWGTNTSTTKTVEPRYWHSFNSGSGKFVDLAGDHCFMSNDGFTGNHCIKVVSTAIFGIVANGTFTSGRLNADNMDAENTANNAYIYTEIDSTDNYDDNFYQEFTGRPDSLVFWAKFSQESPNSDYPYASVSAVLTDGTYYQDPEDKEYSNKIGSAKDSTIATTDGQWVKVSVPFEYLSEDTPKALLCTFSTNATPGKGSKQGGLFSKAKIDVLCIDDVKMIYNHQLESIKVKGQNLEGFSKDTYTYDLGLLTAAPTSEDIEAVADGKGATVETVFDDEAHQVIITVKANDYAVSEQASTYTINYQTIATGIQQVEKSSSADDVYNINGQKATSTRNGNIYIIRDHQGNVKKAVK